MIEWIVSAVAAGIVYSVWQNNDIVTTKIRYRSKKVPDEFRDYVIAQISDLHDKSFGKEGKRLIKKIREASPDLIVVTGDLINKRGCRMENAMALIAAAAKIAPVYYVPGNHEAWADNFQKVVKRLQNNKTVKILKNKTAELKKGDGKITMIGLSDPAFLKTKRFGKTDSSQIEKYLSGLPNHQDFKIALSHRPELFDLYAGHHLNLIFTGHAHGGQIRLPFVGGLYAPGQGFFPKYTSGMHTKENTAMVVSRGLGGSIFPVRVFNRPELVVLTLQPKAKQA